VSLLLFKQLLQENTNYVPYGNVASGITLKNEAKNERKTKPPKIFPENMQAKAAGLPAETLV